jgi:hypothetical protein
MKWKSRKLEIYTKKTRWHKFFTIVPRKVLDQDNNQMWWAWFMTIERIGKQNFLGEWSYTYRLPSINDKTLD